MASDRNEYRSSNQLPALPSEQQWQEQHHRDEQNYTVPFADALTIAIALGDLAALQGQLQRYRSDPALWSRPIAVKKHSPSSCSNLSKYSAKYSSELASTPSAESSAASDRPTNHFASDGALLRAVSFGNQQLAIEMTRMLLEAKDGVPLCCDVNEHQRHTGYTALHLAVRHKNASLVQMLLAAEVNVNARDAKGFTPLHWIISTTGSAYDKKNSEEKDCKGGIPNFKDQNLKSTNAPSISFSSSKGHFVYTTQNTFSPLRLNDNKMLEYLLASGRCDIERCAKGGASPLAMAVFCHNYSACQCLLNYGCTINHFKIGLLDVPDPMVILSHPSDRNDSTLQLLEDNGWARD